MKAIICLLFISFNLEILHAQNPNFAWARDMGGTGVCFGGSVAIDVTENVYTTGIFNGTVDFDPGPAVYNLIGSSTVDIYISKLDLLGNFVWAKQISGMGENFSNSIALDVNGNVYITGRFQFTVDFDPGPGINNMTSITGSDFFICKLDPSGNFIWAKQFGQWAVDCKNYLDLDANGNIYLNGNFEGTADFDPGPAIYNLTSTGPSDIFVAKLDASGNFVWAKQITATSFNYVFDIVVDENGNVLSTGDFLGTADFDPGPGTYNVTSVGLYDGYLLKLDPNGNFLWAKIIGNTGIEASFSISVDATGNVFSSGAFTGTVDFDPGPGIYNMTGSGNFSENYYLSKLDAAGNFLWAIQAIANGSEILGDNTTTDSNGDIYTIGRFRGIVDFDPGAGLFNISSLGTADIFITKLNASGNFLWTKTMGGTNANGAGSDIKVTQNENVYSTGTFYGTIDFDAGTNVYNLQSIGNWDMFVHKMSQCANSTSSTITASACSSYTLNGQTYTATGVYIQTLVNTAGCDSIITLNLTINKIYTSFNAAACDSYTWNSQTYTSTGTYRDTLPAANGCDSIITLNLVINSRSSSIINAAICPGQHYAGYTSTGTYIDTLVASNSCDSIRTLNLTVNTGSFSFIDTTICAGRNYAGYTSTGIYIDTLIAVNGCDSLRTIDLTIKNNCGIYIPNAFTPNNDGLNDIFKPTINLQFQQFSFIVFNRYGQKVFETRDYSKGWDGTLKGKPQPSGSYVYQIKYTNIFGVETVENGTVLLIR